MNKIILLRVGAIKADKKSRSGSQDGYSSCSIQYISHSGTKSVVYSISGDWELGRSVPVFSLR